MLKHLGQRWAVINRNKSLKLAFNFQLSQPSGKLSALVQGIWSASVPQPDSVVKPLYSDAGSGIIFNLVGDVTIGNETLPEGVIMLPIKKQAEKIVLSSGAQLECIEQDEAPGQLSESIELSQRQIERLFKLWLGMTPKHYQRILRIKKAIYFLRLHRNVNLADVAQQFGFSDQAHMTWEFRTIACITPGQV